MLDPVPQQSLSEVLASDEPLTVSEHAGKEDVGAEDVFKLARAHGATMVDLKFTDLPGHWQHMSLALRSLDEDAFTDGLGFDGSSIRGFQEIAESDMLLVPDATTAVIDPFYQQRTLSLICNVVDPITRETYSRDPRYIAQKAERHLNDTGVASVCYFGPEAEFYIFEHVAYDQLPHTAYYEVDSQEAFWNRGQGFGDRLDPVPNLGHKMRSQEGYFPAPPMDTHGDLRALMVSVLEAMGIRTEFHHHEVGGPGQAEIDLRFLPLLRMGDSLQLHKYVVRNTARAVGKSATFMPKPVFEENGSGMHVHQSLWRGDENLMFDAGGYALLSPLALNYIGGLLAHGRALMAFAAPTSNSYRRLVPGYEAPVNLVYSQRNRSAAVRIPMYSPSPRSKRVEFRPPDPTANPYLTFSAMMMAGLDGIERGLTPPGPLDTDLYELSPEELAAIEYVPASLHEALDALEADQDFLLKGGVFTPDLLETWIEYKRAEADQVRLRPHPWEFVLYYDG
ncbi:MAG TPA: type I glutamate--ammonia ligase [Solirubrobacteraceae bacterium]|nr:type I glutamate--ammonia ligase [Solirubrobacteraceae bacterium]